MGSEEGGVMALLHYYFAFYLVCVCAYIARLVFCQCEYRRCV